MRVFNHGCVSLSFFFACGAAKPEKELIFISSHVRKECEVMGAGGLTDVKMCCIRLGWSAPRFAC